jgi:hypothetical protein
MKNGCMTKGLHDYSAGTKAAPFHVAVRSCYFSECEHPIIEWVATYLSSVSTSVTSVERNPALLGTTRQ